VALEVGWRVNDKGQLMKTFRSNSGTPAAVLALVLGIRL